MSCGDAYIYAVVLSFEAAQKAWRVCEKLHYLRENQAEINKIASEHNGADDEDTRIRRQAWRKADEYTPLIEEQERLLKDIMHNPLYVDCVCDDSHSGYKVLEKELLELQPVRNFCEAHKEHAWIRPELEAFDATCLILVPSHYDVDAEFWADLYDKDETRDNDKEKAYRYGCPYCHMGALLGQNVKPFTCPRCGNALMERQGEVDYSENGKLALYVTLPNGKQMLQNEV